MTLPVGGTVRLFLSQSHGQFQFVVHRGVFVFKVVITTLYTCISKAPYDRIPPQAGWIATTGW